VGDVPHQVANETTVADQDTVSSMLKPGVLDFAGTLRAPRDQRTADDLLERLPERVRSRMSDEQDSRPRRAGRPLETVLTRERITDAALTLIGRSGYASFTMAALATSLRVAPSALYNHAASKQVVLQWLQDHVMTMVDVAGFDTEPWDSALRRWAWSYRDIFATHVPLISIVAVLPVTGAPQTLRMYETVAAGLAAAGVPSAQIVPSIVALESFIFGSAFDVTAPADIFETGVLAGSSPIFSAAVLHGQQNAGMARADVAFEFGLDALVDRIDGVRRP